MIWTDVNQISRHHSSKPAALFDFECLWPKMIVMNEDGYNNDEDGNLFEKRENDFSVDYFFFGRFASAPSHDWVPVKRTIRDDSESGTNKHCVEIWLQWSHPCLTRPHIGVSSFIHSFVRKTFPKPANFIKQKMGGVGTAKRKEIDPIQLQLYLPTTTNQATFFPRPLNYWPITVAH